MQHTMTMYRKELDIPIEYESTTHLTKSKIIYQETYALIPPTINR